MVQAISAIGKNPFKDPEYIKIVRELYQLGIEPTGDKKVDKAKLESEKKKLAHKIEAKMQEQAASQNIDPQRTQMEEERLGAMNVAELNKILLGLR